MKKLFIMILIAGFAIHAAWAGGIMTNTNQSASYIRMLARDASLGIDAAYYNPAGLTRLSDGFHLSLNNQSIVQTRKIENTMPLLKSGYYQGDVSALLFPSVYAVYKTGRLAVSGGFMPVGGGGGADYDRGLPSFETALAAVPLQLTNFGLPTTAYDIDIAFEGSSIFFGGQLGVSYQLTDMVDVYGGLRYVTATNTYKGHLRNFTVNPTHPLNPGGGMVSGRDFLNNLAAVASGAAQSVQPLIDGGAGSLTLNQAVDMTLISQEQAMQLAGGLGAMYDESMTINQVQGAYSTTAMTAAGFAEQLSDRRVDARQTGTAIAPLLGVNLQLSDQLNIGIKYEFLTKLELENDTEIDETGMFPDGATTRSDMPAMLSVGAAYRATPQLNIAGGVHYYFDKSADYGKTVGGNRVDNDVVIDNNFIELALGLEYDINESLLLSAGYLRTITGVNEKYHSDLSHSLSTHSIGLGGRYAINDMIAVNLGFLMTFYEEDQKEFTMQGLPPFTEIYNREVVVFAIGMDFKF